MTQAIYYLKTPAIVGAMAATKSSKKDSGEKPGRSRIRTAADIGEKPSQPQRRSGVREWSFLTNHARVLLCVAEDPGVRLRDIAATIDITERTAFGIVSDLADAGYLLKQRDGRRNRYEIRHDLPLHDTGSRERTIGQLLELLAGDDDQERSVVTRG